MAPDGSLMAVPVDDSDGFRVGVPRRLFDLGDDDVRYEVSNNGERFLANVPIEERPDLNVVLDWTQHLPPN